MQTLQILYLNMIYLIHLPSLILKFGPLIRAWCMCFEAKHAYFKDQAKIIEKH